MTIDLTYPSLWQETKNPLLFKVSDSIISHQHSYKMDSWITHKVKVLDNPPTKKSIWIPIVDA